MEPALAHTARTSSANASSSGRDDHRRDDIVVDVVIIIIIIITTVFVFISSRRRGECARPPRDFFNFVWSEVLHCLAHSQVSKDHPPARTHSFFG